MFETRPRTTASSASRPMKLDTCAGKFVSSPGLSAMRGPPRPDQKVMNGRHPRPRIAQPLHHRDRTLDVGERKRERLRGHQPKAPHRD